MLWLCIALPQLPLEALRARNDDIPTVVTSCEGNTRWIVCSNRAAERRGLKPPMNFTVALAMYPQVNTLERNLKAERSALERRAAGAYQFSSTIGLGDIAPALRKARHRLLWIEIGASLILVGGLRPLLARIEQALAEWSFAWRLGVGPTLEGGALLARAGIRLAIMSTERFSARICNLPIRSLALT